MAIDVDIGGRISGQRARDLVQRILELGLDVVAVEGEGDRRGHVQDDLVTLANHLDAGAGRAFAKLAFLLVHVGARSEEHTSALQSLMRISYAVFCLKKQKYKE